MARPGKAPKSAPPEVLCPRGAQGFGNLPKDRPGLGETTYMTSESSLRTNGVLFPNTQVGRVSLLPQEVPLINSFTHFRIFKSLSPLLQYTIMYISGHLCLTYRYYTTFAGQTHKNSFLSYNVEPLSSSARDKLTQSPVSPQGPPLVVAGTRNDTRLPRQPESTYRGP